MRNYLFIALICLASCNNTSQPAMVTPHNYTYDYEKLAGTYEGDFGGSDIRIILRYITGTHAVGYDLVKGLRRNISGKVEATGSKFNFIQREPGDNEYDGVFTFSIDTATLELAGKWQPLNSKKLQEKQFTLKRNADSLNNDYGETWSDSLGDLAFYSNGLCTYQYYPVVNGQKASQYLEVRGSWKEKDSIYTIDWQKNEFFNKNHLILKRMRHDDTSAYDTLRGEGRIYLLPNFG